MADTLNFGPEWLRALSDGNTVASPPPTPGLGGKFKLANNRYGREEMLALFHDQYKAPDELKEIPSIYCEAIQKPLAFMNLSEEEQRLMSQSVNSVTVLRSMGRGSGPPTRGRGGSTADRGRGRGRGRGEYIHRTISENGEHNTHSGGFGVPGRNVNNDGWEEVGKKYERGGYISRNYDETTDRGGIRQHYNRSLSNDNWREKNNNEEDDGSWRRAGTRDKWNKDSRGNWRDPNHHDNQDNDRKQSNGFSRDGPPGRQYQRSRSSESWDTEDNLPEWSTEVDDPETVGSFDASGAFVSTFKEPGGLEDELEEKPDKENQVPAVSKEKVKENNNNNKTKEEPNQKSAKSANINSNNGPNGDPKSSNNKTDINPNNIRASPLQLIDRRGGNQNEKSSRASPSLTQRPSINNKTQHNNLTAPQKLSPSRSAPDLKLKEGEALDFMKLEAENLVALVTDEDDFVPSMKESSSQQIPQQPSSQETFKWLYKDPQGDIQGPFTSDEMAEWFSAGYFTMSLLVKRLCDERFQQLGDLIKRWGRVPFLAGLAPPPLLNSPVTTLPTDQPAVLPPISQPPIQTSVTPPNEQINVLQQQFMLQQQMLQQQLLMRQLQQQQQQQMVLQQMQEQEGFKSLPLAQQQQLMMQMMMSQPPIMLPQQQQQLQQAAVAAQQQHRLSPLHTEQGGISNHPSFHRSMSQPSSKSDNHGGEETIWGGVNTTSAAPNPLAAGGFSQPTSVWDLEAGKQSDPADLHAQIQRMQQEMERVKRLEEERKREEEIKQLELQRKQEDIKQQQEMLMREKQEIERQRQLEIQKIEAATRQQQEEEQKQAEEMMRQEQERQRQLHLEEHRRREEEARIEEELRRVEEQQRAEERRLEEERKKEEKRKEEERKREEKRLKEEAKRKMEEERKRQQEMLQQQELMRQQELQRLELEEQQRKQEEVERQAELQRQQQEALRKLQQQQREQLSNIKLPATAQWAKQQNGGSNITNSLSLTEIQQQEHQKWLEEEQQRQIEMQQRQHMEILQQKQQAQQQQQKSWASHVQSPASNRKSLMQIQQEEQAKLVEAERKRQQQTQQKQTQPNKNVSLASAAAWAGSASNNNSSVWGSESGAAGGIWEQPPSSKKKAAATVAKDFPALKDKKGGAAATKATKTTNAKTTKEEVVVKSLFKPQQKSDEFTTWCENALKTIATSVDVPTFIAFLQDVESPYEVHDYVRSYLGETKAVNDFSKMYLEKRSQYKNKKRQEKRQQEDSIWGPAPAINPKERKPAQASDGGNAQKSKGKKKKKMQKLDGSVLGFTCQAAPDRVNAGEIENIL
ncbi:hypothetical protein LOTGIDRAFT_171304 [Lottia gigantea]|uniref:GYF domain-containing protein n=1 Tax=Lottia gigantea TaxID=225164 RepID=V4B0F2_LOTGI|nr:hypothetical protein LOTGIDRAFT_171304 [Lottia gigantea]ESP03518.1 hypothetical protein LOTGIDRAFT_171304 [Lottia gigantea]